MSITPIVTALLAFLLTVVASAQEAAPPTTAPAVTLPADAEHATQALLGSPRHGEWVDVAIPDGDTGKVRTWVTYPERSDKAPVVIVVHEIFGMTDWVRAVADQLAAEGFIAVAPDLLSGKGPDGGGTESFEGDKVRAAIRELTGEEVARRLNAVRDYATALPAARPVTGCIGFCWGGSTTFAYATVQPGLKAAVVWYGTAPRDREGLAHIACPVLGLYGGDDARVTSTVEPTREAMSGLGKPYTARVYDGAGHGFLRNQSDRDGANLKAAKQAWTEAVAFLKKALE